MSGKTARRLLGWGIQTTSVYSDVEQAQDLVFSDGDLALVEGVDALRQDLSAALVTALGSDPLNQRFGFDGFEAIASESDRFVLRERLRVSVVGLLKRDPRVERVEQVLIGEAEISAAAALETGAAPPSSFGEVEIQVAFRIRGRAERLRLSIGSILGSG